MQAARRLRNNETLLLTKLLWKLAALALVK